MTTRTDDDVLIALANYYRAASQTTKEQLREVFPGKNVRDVNLLLKNFYHELLTASDFNECIESINEEKFVNDVTNILANKIPFAECLYPNVLPTLSQWLDRGTVWLWTQDDVIGDNDNVLPAKLSKSGLSDVVSKNSNNKLNISVSDYKLDKIEAIVEQLKAEGVKIVFLFEDIGENLLKFKSVCEKNGLIFKGQLVTIWQEDDSSPLYIKKYLKIPDGYSDNKYFCEKNSLTLVNGINDFDINFGDYAPCEIAGVFDVDDVLLSNTKRFEYFINELREYLYETT
jgi:hypothetical protein